MQRRTANLGMIHSFPTLIVGVDIAKKRHWARMMNLSTGQEIGQAFVFQNNINGFSRLLGKVARAKERVGAVQVIIAMEPSGHYWKPLAWYLTGAGITVVIVNPHHVKKYKELDDNTPTKNDRKDAWIVATLAAEGRFFWCHLPRGIWAELRGHTQGRRQQRAKLNAALVNLRALLDEYFPEYDEVFKNLLGKGSLYILCHYPFPQDLKNLTLEQLARGLKGATRGRVGEKRAVLLLAVAHDSVGVNEGLAAARLRLQQYLEEIEFFQRQLAWTEKAMAAMLEKTGLARYLLSIPGVGIVTAASFLGEVGDPSRYTNWRQLRRLAGYNLTENSSGQHKGQTKISKRGRSELRNILYQASLVSVSKNPEFKALYRYFGRRRDNPLKGAQALVAIACKLLRVMFCLLKKREVYDPQKVVGKGYLEQMSAA